MLDLLPAVHAGNTQKENIGSNDNNMNYQHNATIRRENLHYWQVDLDPGQRIPPHYFEAPNRTAKVALVCRAAFGGPCPVDQSATGIHAPGDMLFFSSQGRLTNCLLVYNVARWIAEQLGKRLVAPLCASAENTEQSCVAGSMQPEHKELNLLVNMGKVYDWDSLGGCQRRTAAIDIRELLGASFMNGVNIGSRRAVQPAVGRRVRQLRCAGDSASTCAWMFTINHQFAGLALERFVHFDLGMLAHAWAEYVGSLKNAEAKKAAVAPGAILETLRRQDAGEPCTRHSLSGEGCSCNVTSTAASACIKGMYRPHILNKSMASGDVAYQLNPPCLRNCRGLSVFDATAGNVFVPNLFQHSGVIDPHRTELCSPLQLTERAASQALALRAELPQSFLCVHWRAADFLSPEPLSRLHGKTMASQFRALGNSSFMAYASARAARRVGTRHILLMTNAQWEKTQQFKMALQRETQDPSSTIAVTIRSCSDAPPDAEKHVCAHDAAGLLLSRSSSFSAHIHRMARSRGIPVEYLSSCPSHRSPLWSQSPLLAGPLLQC